MFAPLPRSKDVVYRELVPGFIGFECKPLRASLSPASCALKWQTPADGSACRGCAVGAIHAGQPGATPPPVTKKCCRCDQSATRIIGLTLCISCFNRTREVVRSENRKGGHPWRMGDVLRDSCAIVAVANSNDSLRNIFASRPSLNAGIRRPGVYQQHAPGSASLAWLDATHIWLEAVTSGADELGRIAERLLPGCLIVESEFSATFSEQWSGEGDQRLTPPRS